MNEGPLAPPPGQGPGAPGKVPEAETVPEDMDENMEYPEDSDEPGFADAASDRETGFLETEPGEGMLPYADPYVNPYSRRLNFDVGHQHIDHTDPSGAGTYLMNQQTGQGEWVPDEGINAPEDEWGVTDDDASGRPGSKEDYDDSWDNDPDQVND